MQVSKSKLGRFFIFIGLILLVVFFAVDQAQHPAYGYFCGGAVGVVLGAMLMLRGRESPPESMRFRTLRRWREQQKQRKAERKKEPFKQ